MNIQQPEALQLADALAADAVSPIDLKAAAELRRLHDVNADLLEALKNLLESHYNSNVINADCIEAEAAINKAEGETE